jgi:hypothetical protein
MPNTPFPSDPVPGQRFYRTDRAEWHTWIDGRWVSDRRRRSGAVWLSPGTSTVFSGNTVVSPDHRISYRPQPLWRRLVRVVDKAAYLLAIVALLANAWLLAVLGYEAWPSSASLSMAIGAAACATSAMHFLLAHYLGQQ